MGGSFPTIGGSASTAATLVRNSPPHPGGCPLVLLRDYFFGCYTPAVQTGHENGMRFAAAYPPAEL